MYFLNAFLAMCGIACGIPLLFIASRLSRKYLPADRVDYNARSIELMEERNGLDANIADSLQKIAATVDLFAEHSGDGDDDQCLI